KPDSARTRVGAEALEWLALGSHLRAEADEDRAADDVQAVHRTPAGEELPEPAGEDSDHAVDEDLESDEARAKDEELQRNVPTARVHELREEGDGEQRHLRIQEIREGAAPEGSPRAPGAVSDVGDGGVVACPQCLEPEVEEV